MRYKGHDVKARGRRNLWDHTWRPQVTVVWQEEGIPRAQPFTLERICSNEIEAVRLGVIFAKEWIDQGKPAPVSLHVW